jgi:hypothetical protein
MEITLNKYSNGKIYKIINNVDDICYVGSSTRELNNRMLEHIGAYKLWITDNLKYPFTSSFNLFNIYGLDNCKIELIENFQCFNKQELNIKESYYIKLLQSVNITIPNRTTQGYRQDNKDKITERNKKYVLNNKDKIKEFQKQYGLINKYKLAEHSKIYRLINKDTITENKKQYYINNKDNINSQRRLKYIEDIDKQKRT